MVGGELRHEVPAVWGRQLLVLHGTGSEGLSLAGRRAGSSAKWWSGGRGEAAGCCAGA